MRNSQRIIWLEHAYERIREDLLPDAPAHVGITTAILKGKSSGGQILGVCSFECMQDVGEGFGDENLITLNLLQGADVIGMLATLVHEMIHHSLEPSVKHGKKFQEVCQQVGLDKPWLATTPNPDLTQALRGISIDLSRSLGFSPVGYYKPPPPKPVKPATRVKLRCPCANRTITLPKATMAMGGIKCAVCGEPFKEMSV